MLCSTVPIHVQQRWQRISDWLHQDTPLSRTFHRQLAEATGWSATECRAAIEEYRRFCLIAALHDGQASPSPEVDQVWHLHLTFTLDYWREFCPQRLGIELHHQPGFGRPGEAQQLRHLYAVTLERYQALFGLPPERWWPTHALLRTDRRKQGFVGLHRVWQVLAGGLGLLGLITAAQAMPSNPLDWRGPEFLALFALLMVIATAASVFLRVRQRNREAQSGGMSLGEPDVWSLAYLAGGPQRLIDTAVAELHRLGLVQWNATKHLPEVVGNALPDDPLLRTVHGAIRQRSLSSLLAVIKSGQMEAVRKRLQQRGWWFTSQQALQICRISALPFALLSSLGIAKIAVGISRDKPVAFLVVLTLISVIIALVTYFKRPGITPKGRQALAAEKKKHQLSARAHRDEQVALAVALAGTAVLAGTAMAGYHDLRRPGSSDSSSGGCSSDSGGGGSGGGCGGCGGGGD